MSYCRFSDDSDVYVFTSSLGIECCGCHLQKREWVEDAGRPILGGYLKDKGRHVKDVFRSNEAMIHHLERHRRAGHDVPEYALERLRDPKDAAENRRIWRKYAKETA